MIRKLLIANRGEVVLRITRTCWEMGIATVGIFSDADQTAKHVRFVDEAVRVGGAPAAESYLNIPAILDAARRTEADAVHPGFGFLAENADFAQAVLDAGLVWIGPTSGAIAAMGDKRRAKLLLEGIPLIPGYNGEDQSDEALTAAAGEIGVPLLVKAAAGGGGKGMRRVDDLAHLPEALEGARREAQKAFGDGTLILEQYVERARHVEIQILGDTHDNIIALGERECSIQRRHQKVIEECPSPAVDDDLRAHMSETAVSIGRQLGYVSAGTVEFLLAPDGRFSFIEMNTRLQVEHPVTEKVYGVDLVALQIQIAEGGALPDLLAEVKRNGHAVEVRVYAEDPANDFLPSTGTILNWMPNGMGNHVRVDSGIEAGSQVTIHYDPMLAKVIAHAPTRAEALRRLDRTLGETGIFGIRHNIGFLRRVLLHPDFAAGDFDTGFLDRHPDLAAAGATRTPSPHALIAAALKRIEPARYESHPASARPVRQTFRHGSRPFTVILEATGASRYTATIDGNAHQVGFGEANDELIVNGHLKRTRAYRQGKDEVYWVGWGSEVYDLEWLDPLPVGRAPAESAGSLRAPMPGQVLKVDVKIEQFVLKGSILMVIEAMKMEHRILAPYDGTVKAIHYNIGESVQQGVTLLDLQASNPT